MDPSQVHRLGLIMSEIGPDSPEITAVLQDAESSWAIHLDNGRVVHLAVRTAPARLELMTSIGALREQTPQEVLKTLLMFNFLSLDTGGARMALGGLGEQVYMLQDLPESVLSTMALQSAVRVLANAAAGWQEYLADASAPARNALPASHDSR